MESCCQSGGGSEAYSVFSLSSRSGDANATRLWWKHDATAIAKMGTATLKLREATTEDREVRYSNDTSSISIEFLF